MAARGRQPTQARRTRRPTVLLVVIVCGLVALGAGLSWSGWWFRLLHPLGYSSWIRAHARNYELPPELIAAVIYQESRFDPKARSSAGAIGLMQVTPTTARGIAVHTGGHRFRVSDLTDPEINMRYGSFYLQRLHRRFDRNDDSFTASLAAYNAGQGRVERWLRTDADGRLAIDEIPYEETRHYVRSVQRLRVGYRRAYRQQLGAG